MESLGPFVLVVVVAGMALLVAAIIRQDRKRAAARAEAASLRGWTYSTGGGHRLIYSLEGRQDGLPWRVECRSGGKNSSGRTVFTCREASLDGGAVLLGAAEMAALFRSPMGRKVTGWAVGLGNALGVETGPMEQVIERGAEVDLGMPHFTERFFVLATDEAAARRVVTARSAEALLAFAPPDFGGRQKARALTLTWGSEGMTVLLGRSLTSPEDMVSFAELGVALAKETLRKTW
ncbi:MAG: hypothetical protein ACOYXN_05970 [Acidobacteriota bacterium]